MVRKPVQFIPQTDHAADDDQRRAGHLLRQNIQPIQSAGDDLLVDRGAVFDDCGRHIRRHAVGDQLFADRRRLV